MSLDINLTGVEKTSNKKTNLTDNSDTFYPSQKAVKTAVDAKFNTPTGTTAQYLRGDGSLETFPTIPDVTGLQSKTVVVSANQTAVNDAWYINVANATYTDPSPIEGRGFTVDVLNATATINSVAYSIVGTRIVRRFHSGAWITIISLPDSNFVPTTRTINGLDLSANRTLTANDVGAVATTRTITINGTTQDLSADRTFSAVLLTGMPSVANVGLSGSIRYFGFSGLATATSEVTRRIIICNNMTLKNFYVYTSTAQPATGSHVLTILKNGVATGITITIPSGSAAGLFSDTINSESFAQGDAISIQAVNNAAINSGIIVSFQIGSL